MEVGWGACKKGFLTGLGLCQKHSVICSGEPGNTRNRALFSRILRFSPKIVQIRWDFVKILRILPQNHPETSDPELPTPQRPWSLGAPKVLGL